MYWYQRYRLNCSCEEMAVAQSQACTFLSYQFMYPDYSLIELISQVLELTLWSKLLLFLKNGFLTLWLDWNSSPECFIGSNITAISYNLFSSNTKTCVIYETASVFVVTIYNISQSGHNIKNETLCRNTTCKNVVPSVNMP